MTELQASSELAAALAHIAEGEAKGLTMKTMAKRYKRLFAAEDAIKALSGGWR